MGREAILRNFTSKGSREMSGGVGSRDRQLFGGRQFSLVTRSVRRRVKEPEGERGLGHRSGAGVPLSGHSSATVAGRKAAKTVTGPDRLGDLEVGL